MIHLRNEMDGMNAGRLLCDLSCTCTATGVFWMQDEKSCSFIRANVR